MKNNNGDNVYNINDMRENTPTEPGMPPSFQADELIFDAMEEPDRRRRLQLIYQALAIHPECVDAYNMLARDAALDTVEELVYYRQGLIAGGKELGKDFFRENEGHFWGLVETRPYMRAKLGYAETLWLLDNKQDAVEEFRHMLKLCPDDNLGIRYLLLPRLIELDMDDQAQELYQSFDDGTACWAYSRILLDFRKSGSAPAEHIDEALASNAYVPPYIAGNKRLPKEIPDEYQLGSPEEAIIYISESGAAWKATPGAREWLRKELTARGLTPTGRQRKSSKKKGK
ncbi:MAG: hypothetical protein K9L28_08190 [Synergistales bacterium]|nr:hypothetical protein [Synergistales bacterium]